MPFDWLLYLKSAGIVLLPVGITLVLYLFRRISSFGAPGKPFHALLIGLLFGAASVFATEFQINFGGVSVSVSDAAPLCAGLIFSGPAGIIAGIIGGAERYFAVLWGADAYTRLADTLSIVFAGFYAAFLREKLLDKKPPATLMALATGIVMEIIHMTAIFVTHISDAGQAFETIKLCTIPIVATAAITLFIASAAISLIDTLFDGRQLNIKTITQKIQGPLVAVVVAAYIITTLFVYVLQTSTADFDAAGTIDTNISDIKSDVIDSVNVGILNKLRTIKTRYDRNPAVNLQSLADYYDIGEINYVDSTGTIVKSTVSERIGFDMKSDETTSEFLVLLNGGNDEYIQELRLNEDGNKTPLRKYAGIKSATGGFVEIGVNFELFADTVKNNILKFTENRHIGNEGYFIIADRDRTIISNGENAGKKLEEIGIKLSENLSYSDIHKAKISDTPSVYKYVVSEGYYLFGVMPEDEVYSTREASTYVNSFMLVIIFAVIYMLIFFVIKRVVLKDIQEINYDVTKIAFGDLAVWLQYNSTAEFAGLSNGINQAVAALRHYNDEEKRRIEKELELAKNIQYSALPSSFPAPAEYSIYAHMRTAKEVGGDFYDFYMIDQNKLVFMIADVSGKGVPAAMFMMTAKTMLKSLTESGMTENEVFNRANEKLCENNDAGMFVTAWMGVLDTSTGHVKFVNAGHNPPLVYRNGEGYDYLHCKSGFVLSGIENSRYKVQELDLNPGDKIFLYTDGVTEATNFTNTLYGEDRLKNYLNTIPDCDVVKSISNVLADIDRFVDKADQFDDITMVMVQYNGPLPNMNMGHILSMDDEPLPEEPTEETAEKEAGETKPEETKSETEEKK